MELFFNASRGAGAATMTDASRTAPPGARTRSRGYRSSFLQAYVARIADRLAEINATVMADAEAEHGSALVPVLEERARAVDEAIEAMFPASATSGCAVGRTRSAGWVAGRRPISSSTPRSSTTGLRASVPRVGTTPARAHRRPDRRSIPVRYRSPDEDSGRWLDFEYRDGDIVISTCSKSGTTWVQMICALLVFQTPELPAPLGELSPGWTGSSCRGTSSRPTSRRRTTAGS